MKAKTSEKHSTKQAIDWETPLVAFVIQIIMTISGLQIESGLVMPVVVVYPLLGMIFRHRSTLAVRFSLLIMMSSSLALYLLA